MPPMRRTLGGYGSAPMQPQPGQMGGGMMQRRQMGPGGPPPPMAPMQAPLPPPGQPELNDPQAAMNPENIQDYLRRLLGQRGMGQ